MPILESGVACKLQYMVVGKGLTASLDVLVHITQFQVKPGVDPITCSEVGPVLVECFAINMGIITHIEKHFILNGGKDAVFERFVRCEGKDRPEKIPDAVGINVTLIHPIFPFNGGSTEEPLFQPEAVSQGGMGQGMRVNKLLPDPVFRHHSRQGTGAG